MNEIPRHVIKAQQLTSEAFESFGWLPVSDTDPRDGARRLEFEWADPHLNVISHGPDEVTRTDEGLVCERMFRHATHTQALLVLDTESVVAVAPAGVDFEDPRDLDHLMAFRLSPLDSLVLSRGTWHWGPFPVGGQAVHLYNVQGRLYERDNDSVDVSRFGLVVNP